MTNRDMQLISRSLSPVIRELVSGAVASRTVELEQRIAALESQAGNKAGIAVWQAKGYPAGALVECDGYVWRALKATSDVPESSSAGWSRVVQPVVMT